MNTKRIPICFLTVFLVIALLTAVGTLFVGASGGVTEIDTEEELLAITDGNYKLTKNLTVSASVPAFTGTLDGNGHTVTVSSPLFTTLSGEVKNLTLKGKITTDSASPVGALANTVSGNLSLDNLTSEVSITAPKAVGVGGFIGAVSGKHTVTLMNTKNTGNLSALADVGGFIGLIKGASAASHASVLISYAENIGSTEMTTPDKNHGVGGFIGAATFYTVEISYSVNKGDVSYSGGDSGAAGFLGGSAAWNNSNVTKDIFTARYCANLGNVTLTGTTAANGRIGGITGRMNRDHGSVYTYEYCLNTGNITGKAASASGITGYTNTKATVKAIGCYNVGTLSGTTTYAIGTTNDNTDYVTASDNHYLGAVNSTKAKIDAKAEADQSALNTALLALENTPYLVDPDDNDGYAILSFMCKHQKTETICTGEICKLCEKTVSVTAGDHSFSAWQTVTPATVTADGEKTRSCSACGETETAVIDATGKITPLGGIYAIETEEQFLWLVANLNNETLSPDIHVILSEDIGLTKGNDTVTVTFTGTFDGRNHTLSGITNTLFKQLNGTFKNCTLKGTIDYRTKTNNKAASVAMNGQDVIIRNVLSEVDIKTKGGNVNAGGILGYGKGAVVLLDVEYAGDYELTWTAQNAGAGGVVGWINTNGKTTALENCRFTGSLTITVESTGEIDIGSILGHGGSSSAATEIVGCVSTGSVTVNETASEKIYVGGIVGKFNDGDASYIKRSVNNTDITLPDSASYGSLLGRVTNKTGYLLENCAVMNSSANWCANSDELTVTGCYNKDTLKAIGDAFTREGVTYQKYTVGYLNILTSEIVSPADIPTPAFGTGTIDYTDSTHCTITTPNYTSFLSTSRGTVSGTSNIRFVIAADREVLFTNKHLYLTITFLNGSEPLRTLKKEVATELSVYQSAIAAGITYTAGEGDVLFGIVITDIPDLGWTDVSVTLTNEELGVAEGVIDTEHALHTAPRHFSELKIGNTPIENYTIVYAESPFSTYAESIATKDLYPVYDFDRESAERLRDMIYYFTGKKLKVVMDTAPESEHEILIGQTNRVGTTASLFLGDMTPDDYLIDVENKKLIVCGGEYGTTWHALDSLENLLADTIANETYRYSIAESFSEKGEYRLTRIGCIGDSITQGTGSSNQALYAYPAQLGRLLWKDAIVSNYGRSGSTMRSDLADAYTKRAAYTNALNAAKDTDIFIIMLGTNDSNRDQNWNDASSEKYNQSCLDIVKALKTENPNVRFVLANCPTYFGTRSFGSETVRTLQSALVKTLNEQGYPTEFFDMHTVTATMKDYFPDELHPNNTGHKLMAEAFSKALKPMIEKQ